MTDTEAQKPWPLVATSVISDIEARYVRDGVDLLRMHLDNLYLTTRKKLQEEGRMGDVRSLKLFVYDYDVINQPQGEG